MIPVKRDRGAFTDLPGTPILPDLVFFLVALPAVALAGLSKGGFAGVGMISTPLVATVVPPVQAAAIILPILILQDLIGLMKFRRDVDLPNVLRLLPGALLGIGAGYLMAAAMSDRVVAFMVGAIALGYALRSLLLRSRRRHIATGGPDWPLGTLAGAGAGFTSMIANAGAPPVQIYLLRQNLTRDAFIGTSTVFFATVNWLKLPAFLALGQIDAESLTTSAMLAPVAVIATLLGVRLVRLVPQALFFDLIQVLMALVGAKLLFDAVG